MTISKVQLASLVVLLFCVLSIPFRTAYGQSGDVPKEVFFESQIGSPLRDRNLAKLEGNWVEGVFLSSGTVSVRGPCILRKIDKGLLAAGATRWDLVKGCFVVSNSEMTVTRVGKIFLVAGFLDDKALHAIKITDQPRMVAMYEFKFDVLKSYLNKNRLNGRLVVHGHADHLTIDNDERLMACLNADDSAAMFEQVPYYILAPSDEMNEIEKYLVEKAKVRVAQTGVEVVDRKFCSIEPRKVRTQGENKVPQVKSTTELPRTQINSLE